LRCCRFAVLLLGLLGCVPESTKSDDSGQEESPSTPDIDDADGTVLADTGSSPSDDADGEAPADTGSPPSDDTDGEAPADTGSPPSDDADGGSSVDPGEVDTAVSDSADPSPPVDLDEDGVTEEMGDCDDADPSIHPEAEELCDGIDNNCDGTVDEGVLLTLYVDYDADGFGSDTLTMEGCTAEGMWVESASDCDDLDPFTYPEAPEICDGFDNDCDDSIDEDVVSTFYVDGDGDGHGDPADVVYGCLPPEGAVATSDDCDDGDALVSPDADEVCDGIDNDCNSVVDDGVLSTFFIDYDHDGYGSTAYTEEACEVPDGYAVDSTDCIDTDAEVNPGVGEICDGIDNNCDGEIDEGVMSTFYADADADEYGDPLVVGLGCAPPDGFVDDNSDCNDDDASAYLGAVEVCDGVDNNCDGSIDELVTTAFHRDADEDGHGDPDEVIYSCEMPEGYVLGGTDCNDTDGSSFEGAPELCDGTDNDCDMEIDEGALSLYYIDYDADGYGSAAYFVEACEAPVGFVADVTDCDDLNDAVSPAAVEICDGIDNNCDGGIDDGVGSTFYSDLDGDGFGNPLASVETCEPGPWMVSDGSDCDDTSPGIHPGATEVCDEQDNNCDGTIDEGVTSTFYMDFDGDGYGSEDDTVEQCAPTVDFVADMTDCDDDVAFSHPGAPDECDDGIDSDCDGEESPSCYSSCGDGVLDTDEFEELDPPISPFSSIDVDDETCRWDFSEVSQLYCNGGCTWAGSSDCDTADANIFCKLRTGNPDSVALSFTTTTALPEPGFPCILHSVPSLYLDRGVDMAVPYQDWSILSDHGPGTVIVDPVCTDP
jgi:large repetitive protein